MIVHRWGRTTRAAAPFARGASAPNRQRNAIRLCRPVRAGGFGSAWAHRLDQHHSGHIPRVLVREHPYRHAAHRVPDQHVRARHACVQSAAREAPPRSVRRCAAGVRPRCSPFPRGRRCRPASCWRLPGCTQLLHAPDESPHPASITTVGLPVPMQLMWRRWPPTSTIWPGGG